MTVRDRLRRAVQWSVRVCAVREVRPTAAGAWVTAAFIVAIAAVLFRSGGSVEVPPTPVLIAALATALPLLVRMRAPLLALVGTVVAEAWYIATLAIVAPATGTDTEDLSRYQPIATLLAVATFASRVPRRVGWAAGGIATLVLFVTAVISHGGQQLFGDLAMANLVVIATAIGAGAGARADHLEAKERQRRDEMQQAVLDERLRIAQELHDVLAHNLTLVNAQAAVAQYLIASSPDAAATALKDVTRHSARAIDELRATVGLLRRDDGADPPAAEPLVRPTPDRGSVTELVDGMRGIGLEVDLDIDGEPVDLGHYGDLAAYRILQEALTNAAKHASRARVAVTLTWQQDGLLLEITNPRAAAPAAAVPGTGHGIIGMRERARAAGGELTIEESGATFTVRARIPGTALEHEVGGGRGTTG